MKTRPVGEIEWVSTADAAESLGIALRTLYRLIDEGGLPAYKFGRVIRLMRADLDAYVESQRIEPGTLRHLYAPGRDPASDPK
jgi:excisionase family DNA binding protein